MVVKQDPIIKNFKIDEKCKAETLDNRRSFKT